MRTHSNFDNIETVVLITVCFCRPTSMGAPKHDALGFTHIFKAQPLDKVMKHCLQILVR